MTAAPLPPTPSNAPTAQSAAKPTPDKPRRLGRGLASLISTTSQPSVDPAAPAHADAAGHVAAAPGQSLVVNIDIGQIAPNPNQPRRIFDETALAGLADSIRANGLVQPVLVRKMPTGQGGSSSDSPRFQLVAGERRWRASRLAGLSAVPAIVRSLDDDATLELALIENVQRADLNPLERAAAYAAIMRRRNWNQEQFATRLGESRSQIANYLRLFELPQSVQTLVATNSLSFGHAKLVLMFRKPANQELLARTIVERDPSVREVEKWVAAAQADPAGEDALSRILQSLFGMAPGAVADAPLAKPTRTVAKPANIASLEERLTRRIGTRVVIKQGRRADMGKLLIDFYSLDDFDRILELLGIQVDHE